LHNRATLSVIINLKNIRNASKKSREENYMMRHGNINPRQCQ